MFGTLIDIDRDANVFLSDKGVALLPELFVVYKHKRMGSDMVKWIVSVYDYKSPYRNLPFEIRVREITYKIFKKKYNKLTESSEVQRAITEYCNEQYDELIEQYNLMGEKNHEKMKLYKAMPVTKETLAELNSLELEMHRGAQERQKLKAIIIKNQQEEVKIHGAKENSFSVMEERLRMNDK